MPAPSHVDHINIVVADLERSLEFYVGALGLEQTFTATLEGAWIETLTGLPGACARCAFCQFPGGGARLELLEYAPPPGADPAQNGWADTRGLRHFALDVDDVDAWHARLSARGVGFVSPPVSVPFLVAGRRKRLCYGRDPDGVLFELASYSPTPAGEESQHR